MIIVFLMLLLSIGANLMLSSYIRRKCAKRIQLQEVLRPWLTEKLGRRRARSFLRSLGNVLDILPDDTLQELLDAAPCISESELLELIYSVVELFESSLQVNTLT